ncbi:MAG: alpha/beta hydrolase [Pseudobutyrivibrio sp.]|nr:alpha/beta hydrolase [Pseudobutyrivibrio sp.]
MSLVNYLILKNGLKTKRYFNGVESKDYVAIRKEELQQVSLVKKPKDVTDSEISISGVKVNMISKTSNPKEKIIMYIHGGGFVTGSPESRTMFTYYVADKMGFNVAAVDYRLAPENPFPAGVDDCINVYAELEKKYGAENIILAGESAGANLTLVTLLKIKERGLHFPKCSFAFSPCVQYDRVLDSYINNQKTEGMVTNLSEEVAAVYVCSEEEEDLKNPFVAPLYGDFTGCSPIYLFASSSETLYDDSILLHEKLKANGVPVSLYLRNKMVHTWIIIPAMPEAKKDLKLFKKLIENAFIDKPIVEKMPKILG